MPAVGKSGAGTIAINSSIVASGFFSRYKQASTISFRLCGGILVAMPTAMPDEPFIRGWARARAGPPAHFHDRRNWARSQPFPDQYRPIIHGRFLPSGFRYNALRPG